MKNSFYLTLVCLTLAGCSNASRSFYLPTFEERTISGERVVEGKKLSVPSDWRNPTLVPPTGQQIESVPLPPPRPARLGNT